MVMYMVAMTTLTSENDIFSFLETLICDFLFFSTKNIMVVALSFGFYLMNDV
jgi:hypothetical protein